MDIIATPAAPPPVIRRADYRPPGEVNNRTSSGATLQVRRNPAEGAGQALRLNGDGLAALAVEVDGTAVNDWRMDGDDLLVELPGDAHAVRIVTAINPAANSQLMGLYASNGMLCTQCEAEGFRRITFFPDRPYVMARYSCTIEADQARFPQLLSNGSSTFSSAESTGIRL